MWSEEKSKDAKNLLEDGKTYKEISLIVGESYSSVKNHLSKKYGIRQTHFNNKRFKTEIECKACKKKFSVSKLDKERKFCSRTCSNLGVNRWGTNKENKICPNCFKEAPKKTVFCDWNCYKEFQFKKSKRKLEDGKLTDGCRPTIKRILLAERGHKCEICNNSEWNNNPIPITLDHIDGNSENNREENLRLICPNCDAQLPTYKGANKGNGRSWRKKYYKKDL